MGISTTPYSWPAVIIGLIVGIYWLRVLMLVARTKKAAGRAANFIPPEPLGRLLRIIWIPIVGLWIFWPMLTPFITGMPEVLMPMPFAGSFMAGWIALGVSIVAFALTWVCWVKMGSSWRMGIDPNERTKLVFNGPYAYVRNPIYGLSQLLVLMAFLALPSIPMLVIAAFHIFLMQWEVRREEKYLMQLHGQVYDDYFRHVGRFIPRLTPWKPNT